VPSQYPGHPFEVVARCRMLIRAGLGCIQECRVACLEQSPGDVIYDTNEHNKGQSLAKLGILCDTLLCGFAKEQANTD
jgi:hypothetical protein